MAASCLIVSTRLTAARAWLYGNLTDFDVLTGPIDIQGGAIFIASFNHRAAWRDLDRSIERWKPLAVVFRTHLYGVGRLALEYGAVAVEDRFSVSGQALTAFEERLARVTKRRFR